MGIETGNAIVDIGIQPRDVPAVEYGGHMIEQKESQVETR